jgi:hypothetical protein
LAKIAFWKIQVQPILKQVQPVFALFTFLKNTGSAGHSTSFCLVETSSTGFKTGPTGFCTVHFFLPVCCVSQKAVRSFLKTGFGTGSTGFWAEKSKTASFGAPPIYTHSHLSPPQESTTWTPFLT